MSESNEESELSKLKRQAMNLYVTISSLKHNSKNSGSLNSYLRERHRAIEARIEEIETKLKIESHP